MTFCQTDFQQDTIDLMVYKQQNFIPHTLKAEKSKIKVLADLCLIRTHFLLHRSLSSCCILA